MKRPYADDEPGCPSNMPPCGEFKPENFRQHRWVTEIDQSGLTGWTTVDRCVDCEMVRIKHRRYIGNKLTVKHYRLEGK